MCIPYSYVKREYRQPRPNSTYTTSINIPKNTLIYQDKNPTDTSDMESLTQDYSIHKKPYPPTYPSQENLIPHTKLLLLKYIHQYLDILSYIHPGDTTNEKNVGVTESSPQKNSTTSLYVDASDTNPTTSK